MHPRLAAFIFQGKDFMRRRCPHCARPLHGFGFYCDVCHTTVYSWPLVFLLVLILAALFGLSFFFPRDF